MLFFVSHLYRFCSHLRTGSLSRRFSAQPHLNLIKFLIYSVSQQCGGSHVLLHTQKIPDLKAGGDTEQPQGSQAAALRVSAPWEGCVRWGMCCKKSAPNYCSFIFCSFPLGNLSRSLCCSFCDLNSNTIKMKKHVVAVLFTARSPLYGAFLNVLPNTSDNQLDISSLHWVILLSFLLSCSGNPLPAFQTLISCPLLSKLIHTVWISTLYPQIIISQQEFQAFLLFTGP